MPSSAVRTFTDPDDYAESIRQATCEATVTGRGIYSAKLTRIDLHLLWMQHFSEELPRIFDVAVWPGRSIIAFRTEPGPAIVWDGVELQPTNIVRFGEDRNYYQCTAGPSRFGTMSLPTADLTSIGATVAGCDLGPQNDVLSITPPPFAMVTLQRLHAAARSMAEDAPAVLAHPEAAHGLEQALIEAMIHCISDGAVDQDRAARGHHAAIMRQFRRAIEEEPDRALFMPELCGAIGVPERSLRVCCQEQLGMSPKRYLLLRRMHLARRALRQDAGAHTTVTEIAARFGFWQFGRFAGEYKLLFGELPSATLARDP